MGKTTLESLIQPHAIFIDITNAIRNEDISALETIRNKLSNAYPDCPTSVILQSSLLQFIDNMATCVSDIVYTENEELANAEAKVRELESKIEDYEKLEISRETRVEALKDKLVLAIQQSDI